MARHNALARNNLQRRLAGQDPFASGFRTLKRFSATVGYGNNPVVRAAGKVLVKALKHVLSVRGGVSRPGEPPHRQSGRLWRGVGMQVVTGVLRVGESWFTAPILEEGADFAGQAARKTGAVKFRPLRGARAGKLTSRRARRAKRGLHIAPRPFTAKALELALPEMQGVVVDELRDRHGPLA